MTYTGDLLGDRFISPSNVARSTSSAIETNQKLFFYYHYKLTTLLFSIHIAMFRCLYRLKAFCPFITYNCLGFYEYLTSRQVLFIKGRRDMTKFLGDNKYISLERKFTKNFPQFSNFKRFDFNIPSPDDIPVFCISSIQ